MTTKMVALKHSLQITKDNNFSKEKSRLNITNWISYVISTNHNEIRLNLGLNTQAKSHSHSSIRFTESVIRMHLLKR